MGKTTKSKIPEIIKKYEQDILEDWIREQLNARSIRPDLLKEAELRRQSAEFLAFLKGVIQKADLTDLATPEWKPVLELLAGLSRDRAVKGFTPTEAATFIFSFKQPLFNRLKIEVGADLKEFSDEIWTATLLLDQLGLYLNEVFQKSREEIISRQKDEMLELSTPVVKLWEGILALPLIGTLDSARTQVVMENLLHMIVETGSSYAIIDISGISLVDTLVAQHLLKTVSAARLMGADCIISGIRPQIAQTIVHLGVSLTDVVTKANMADAFALALERIGYKLKAEGV
jgi:rsbT co-antagonist protein RsbR